ncbi:hypothetical protein [[Limnothrix rosea] IAM M-220]|uniref:hypothetical protein n=1 Tax=[Limnothrix rosea] IAM M-220 TaxID=454133 RepID=UPI000961277F|nr:hypothetical protein [[Limnothrix rosea] IAM M-220]OKH17563.1 hypothetical protein NIES208_08600 [[Limnothrix rosea] IAM M-220]
MKSLGILVILVSAVLFGCDNSSAPVDVSNTSTDSTPTEVTEASSEITPVEITDASTLAAEYVVNGTNPNGSGYVGQVDVATNTDDSVTLEWTINQDKWTGLGEITNEGKLYVRYEGGFSGDGTWTLMSDGSLSGEWKADGDDQSGTEIWKKQ